MPSDSKRACEGWVGGLYLVDDIWRIAELSWKRMGSSYIELVFEFKDFAGRTKPYQTRLTDGFLW